MSGYALVSIIHSEESVIFLKLYLCLALLSVLYTMCISSNMSQLVGLGGLEPPTSRLSGVRSNRLSYKPSVNSLSKYPRYFAMRFVNAKRLLHHVLRTIYSCIHALAQASLRRACLPE